MTLKKISYSAISVLQVFLQMVFDFCRRKHFENTIFCEGLYLFNFYQPGYFPGDKHRLHRLVSQRGFQCTRFLDQSNFAGNPDAEYTCLFISPHAVAL
jgi:hypothetical protein